MYDTLDTGVRGSICGAKELSKVAATQTIPRFSLHSQPGPVCILVNMLLFGKSLEVYVGFLKSKLSVSRTLEVCKDTGHDTSQRNFPLLKLMRPMNALDLLSFEHEHVLMAR